MTAPIWLLDVDGVINGGSRPGWHAAPRNSRAFAHGSAYRMRWAPQATARIRALVMAGLVHVRWATTWIDHNPGQLERLFELPALPLAYPADAARAADPRRTVEHRGLKLQAALDVVRSGRRLIWTDDEAIPTDGAARAELDAAGALLIAPTPGRGIRPAHLDAIEEFTAAAWALA